MKQTSLTTIANGNGLKYRAAWLMAAVAVLLALLAVAVPMQQTVSTDDPEFIVSLTDINNETATLKITITDVPSTIDPTHWIVSVNYSSPSDSQGTSLNSGKGLNRPGRHDDFDGEVDEIGEDEDVRNFVTNLSGSEIASDDIPMVELGCVDNCIKLGACQHLN